MNPLSLTKLFNYLLLISLLVAGIFLAIYMQAILGSPKGHVSEPFSHNMFYANNISDTEVRYYNGNTFVSINPVDLRTKSLTTYRMLPDITQVFWLENGVVFATQEVDSASDLQPVIAQARTLDPETQYGTVPTYWYLSFAENKLKPISMNVMQPDNFGVVATDGSFVFKDDSETYSVIKKNGDIEYGVVDPAEESRPIYATENSLTYLAQSEGSGGDEEVGEEAKGNVVQLKKIAFFQTEPEIISDDIFENEESTINSRVVAIDQTHYIIAQSIADQRIGSDLYIFNTGSKDRKKIIKQFDGPIDRTSKGVVAVKQGRGLNTFHFITKDGVSSRLRVERDENNPAATIFNGKGFVYNTSGGSAFMASKDKGAVDSIKSAYDGSLEKEITGLPNGLSISRNIESPYDTSYTLTFNGKASDALSALHTAIQSKGHDPNQFIITLAPGRSGEF